MPALSPAFHALLASALRPHQTYRFRSTLSPRKQRRNYVTFAACGAVPNAGPSQFQFCARASRQRAMEMSNTGGRLVFVKLDAQIGRTQRQIKRAEHWWTYASDLRVRSLFDPGSESLRRQDRRRREADKRHGHAVGYVTRVVARFTLGIGVERGARLVIRIGLNPQRKGSDIGARG